MKTLKQIKRKIESYKPVLKEKYRVKDISIFGSYARGEQKRNSDVDILVNFKADASLFDFMALADFLEQRLGIDVDLVSEKGLRDELKDNILKEAVTI